jgi:phosphotriesterase-related protein
VSHPIAAGTGEAIDAPAGQTVNTVLGPVPASELGVVAVHEALLSVLPGAQYAPDICMDRAEIFEALAAKLEDFREHGGQTIIDSTGMFHGRDLKLYEALSRTTGVHIVASTGLGPEEELGGYFLTPQTNPPTPWPAEKFGDLFGKEVTEGMVVPRVERRAAAGIVATIADRAGMTPPRRACSAAPPVPPGTPAFRSPSASAPMSCMIWTSSWTSRSGPTGCSSAAWTARTQPAPPSRWPAAEPSSASTTLA